MTAENGYRFLADQEGLVENQKVATALAPYNEELQAYLDQPLGTATGAFSNENISLQPTALMDLLNKAQLSRFLAAAVHLRASDQRQPRFAT